LRRLSEESKSAPSQGAATTYETLNVHTTADRQSPSFFQVKEGEKVDVIGRRTAPRVAPPPPRPPRPAPEERKKKQSKDSKKSKEIAPPPPPRAPKPPANWIELSKLFSPPDPRPVESKPVPMDDWSLIRNKSGETGWVLTRRLVMAIPDEVAQYAEGRRITSYFAIGETRDKDAVKKSWLWTTVEQGLTPYDFDSFRVFIWSLRRHRYETAHIERNLIGYFPILPQPVPAPKGRAGKVPGFSILVQKKDGLRYRRYFAFMDNAVRLSSEERVEAQPRTPVPEPPRKIAAAPPPTAPGKEVSFFGRVRGWSERLFGR
jgi:hypothetical protein